MLKGRAARGFETALVLRRALVAARREKVRLLDMVAACCLLDIDGDALIFVKMRLRETYKSKHKQWCKAQLQSTGIGPGTSNAPRNDVGGASLIEVEAA